MSQLWREHDNLAEKYRPVEYAGEILHFRPRRDYRCHLGTELTARNGVSIRRYRPFPSGMMVNPFIGEIAVDISNVITESVDRFEAQQKQMPQVGSSQAAS